MAFSFGAFAGGAATSGMNTYQMLEAIESQKKRDALIELQMQETKLNMEDRAAIKGLGKETYGRIGQDTITGIGSQQAQGLSNYGAAPRDAEFEAADRQQQLAALRGNVEYQSRPDVQARLTQGPDKGEPVVGLPTTQEQRTALTPGIGKYTEEQATKDYATRLKGIDFEKGIAAEKGLMDIKKGGFELKSLERTDKFSDEYETYRANWAKDVANKKIAIDKEYAMNGPSGVIKSHGAEYEKFTGEKLKMDNKGMVIVTKDGKETGRFPATEFKDKLEAALKMHLTKDFADDLVNKGMFRDADAAIAFGHKRAELGNQTTTANAAMMSAKAKADTVASENAKNFGAADYYKGVGRQPGGGSEEGKAARAAALVKSGEAKDITAAYRIIQGKDARDVVDRDWSTTRLELMKQGSDPGTIAKQKAAFYAENGVAPAEFAQSITSGINPKTGKPFDPKEADGIISDYNRKYPLSAVDPEALTWYKPAAKGSETTTKPTAIPAKTPVQAQFERTQAIRANRPNEDKTGLQIMGDSLARNRALRDNPEMVKLNRELAATNDLDPRKQRAARAEIMRRIKLLEDQPE